VRGGSLLVRDDLHISWEADVPMSEGAVVIFGRGEAFSPAALQALSAAQRPFGIATARDEPALQFLAVKMALEAERRGGGAGRRITAFDELEGVVLSLTGEPHVQSVHRFDASVHARLMDLLDRAALVLHVHGEGSHANLQSVVLCGVSPGRELHKNKPVPGGCVTSPDRNCKRARSSGAAVEGFDSLPDAEIALLSCNGLSVAGALYPSSSSCVFSMVEGSAVRVLCNDRTVPMCHSDVQIVSTVLAAGGSLHDVVWLFNDRERYRSGAAPWFLVGEPRAGLPRHSDGLSAEGGDIYGLKLLRALGTRGVLAVETEAAPRAIWRGEKTITVLESPQKSLATAQRSLRPADEELCNADRIARDGLRRCVEGSLASLATRAVFLNECSPPTELKESLQRLEQTRHATEQAFGNALDLCEAGRAEGLLPDRLSLALLSARLATSTWDREFVTFAEKWLLERSTERVFLAGFLRAGEDGAEPCQRCSMRIPRLRHQSIHFPESSRIAMSCPCCGPAAIISEGDGSIKLVCPTEFAPDRLLVVRVDVPLTASALEELPGWLGMGIRNKATGVITWRGVVPIRDKSTTISIDTSGLGEPDLHTLRLVYARGMQLTYLRRRVVSTGRQRLGDGSEI